MTKPMPEEKPRKPTHVLTARRWLIRWCPYLYHKIAGHEDSRSIESIEYFRMLAKIQGYSWKLIKPFIYQFINCTPETPEKEPIIKNRLKTYQKNHKQSYELSCKREVPSKRLGVS